VTQAWRLTPRAREDLDAIAAYTIEKWGDEQLESYLGALIARFARLAESPMLGRDRADVHPGYRSFPEGSHVVFCMVDGDFINIIGIPHKSMDVGPVFF
jgi:toxin ParE1/3/4